MAEASGIEPLFLRFSKRVKAGWTELLNSKQSIDNGLPPASAGQSGGVRVRKSRLDDLDFKDLPVAVHYMHRAGNAGIEAVYGAQDFQRLSGVVDTMALQRRFGGAAVASRGSAMAEVMPGGSAISEAVAAQNSKKVPG